MARRIALHIVSRIAPLFALLVVLGSVGCGPPWRVIRASGPPSALHGMTALAVTFDYSALMMGGMFEAQWLATQPPDDQSSYLAVRASMEEHFLMELSAQLAREGIAVRRATGAESHQLIVRYTRIEMGFYRFMVSMDSTLDSRFVYGTGGAETDEIDIHLTRTANMRNASIAERMDWCASRAAQLAAEYVRQAR